MLAFVGLPWSGCNGAVLQQAASVGSSCLPHWQPEHRHDATRVTRTGAIAALVVSSFTAGVCRQRASGKRSRAVSRCAQPLMQQSTVVASNSPEEILAEEAGGFATAPASQRRRGALTMMLGSVVGTSFASAPTYAALAPASKTAPPAAPPATPPPASSAAAPKAVPPGAPPNPGDTKNCKDFQTYEEAKAWYDKYFPFYGDVAKLDGDNDGEPCESLRKTTKKK